MSEHRASVLFVTRKWSPAVGGMETYSIELCRRLQSIAQLAVIALPGRADGSTPTPAALVGFGLRTAWRLATGGERHHVVHGGDMALWPLIWLAGLRGVGVRLVLSAHGTDVALATRRGARARAYEAYLRLGARLLSRVVVLANSAATETLARRFGFTDVRIVRLAATALAYPAEPGPPKPYIAFIGRLIPSKGCSWFVDHVLPRLPDEIRLKVAGTIVDRREGECLRSSRVEYLGPLHGQALAELRRNAIAVVAPNLVGGPESFEGFGLAAVEAAAAGGVVVASRAHGMADAVRDGETGFLEPPGDADRWVARLEDVRRWAPARRRAFVDGALRASAVHYSWDRVAEETLAAYLTPDSR